jgi:hypothetical protein
MKKVHRYEDIRPLFTSQKIRTFSDIFEVLSKTAVAEYLGKEKSRFNECIGLPGGFKLKDIIRLAELCNLTLPEMAGLMESEHPTDAITDDKQKDHRYTFIKPLFTTQTIRLFEDIFPRVPKSTVARDIGRKRDRFNYLMDHVEEFFVKDIAGIAQLCELNLVQMFKLIEAQYAKQKTNELDKRG